MEKRVFSNPHVKDKITFIKTSKETAGEYTMIEVELAAGGGTPLLLALDDVDLRKRWGGFGDLPALRFRKMEAPEEEGDFRELETPVHQVA